MPNDPRPSASCTSWICPRSVRKIRARTPARLLLGRAGAAYRTQTQMELREAHAAARDAVRAELNLRPAFGAEFRGHSGNSFEVHTQAPTKRRISSPPRSRPAFRRNIARRNSTPLPPAAICKSPSATACRFPRFRRKFPRLLPLLYPGRWARGWKVGGRFVIHHCRVGILNEIGELLDPRVAVLLIGERPGLATAESLSAYMAYRPRAGHTDADRNLISNIHARGLATGIRRTSHPESRGSNDRHQPRWLHPARKPANSEMIRAI